jgi:hypothetical protein
MRLSLTGILDLEYKAPDHLAKSVEHVMQREFDPMNARDPFGRIGERPVKIKIAIDGVEFDATVLGFKIDDTVAVGIDLD